MPQVLQQILSQIGTPLSFEILVATVVAGLFFGAFYNSRLNLPTTSIYNVALAGISFLVFLFLFRAATQIVEGHDVPSPWGWIGIVLLWLIYCFFIWLGDLAADSRKR